MNKENPTLLGKLVDRYLTRLKQTLALDDTYLYVLKGVTSLVLFRKSINTVSAAMELVGKIASPAIIEAARNQRFHRDSPVVCKDGGIVEFTAPDNLRIVVYTGKLNGVYLDTQSKAKGAETDALEEFGKLIDRETTA